MYNLDLTFYEAIAFSTVAILIVTYFILKKLRKHGTAHTPQVMNKINDFYKTQDSYKINY
ncbi:hypothetical protein AUK15_02805 [Candidatus Nomurabacteria bacterium CG2_30_43_9]|nr:MAG: hypothetical protein AUK15_02805 [Candidatus Nomurabacteria bacterium CG2_30_43_9]